MAYTKQTWENLPSQTTPINADRLTHIEDGIFNAASTADTAASDASSAISGLADKVDKVDGKGLSTNDFTDTLKTKLDNIETGAEVNVQSDWNQSDNSADDYIKNKPTLGTASAKNSTSVVTDSSDLVESGAVLDTLRDAEVVEGKNLLPNKATTTTLNGVTFTVNDNKSITISTVNTGATATTQLTLDSSFEITDDREYIYSGVTSGSASTYYLQVYYRDNNNVYKGAKNLYTEPLNIKLSDFSGATKMNTFILVVPSGAVITTPVTVYPMLRLASETDPTYEPYYIPLKDVVPQKCDNSVIGTVEDGATASQAYAVGSHFIRDGAFCTVTTAISSGESLVGSSKFTSGDVADVLTVKKLAGASAILSGVTIDSGRNNIYKYGKLVFVDIKITVDSDITVTGSQKLIQLPTNAMAITTLIITDASAPYAYQSDFAVYTNPLAESDMVYINSVVLRAGSYTISGFFLEK